MELHFLEIQLFNYRQQYVSAIVINECTLFFS